jgi:type IV pilus assembly protein PilW
MRRRGFTLIELMVGLSVALAVIGVVTATFLSQQRAMQALDISRDASNAARDAMLSMHDNIGRAGYGIDPRYAFDFRNYNCPSFTFGSAPCRDSITAPDEIVFVERDSNYWWAGDPTKNVQGCDPSVPCTGHAWNVTAFDATHVTITANAQDTFLVGQVVEILCPKGEPASGTPGAGMTMGTVSTKAIAAAAGALQITLTTAVSNNPYKQNIGAGHDTCFDNVAQGGVSMFLVNRYRYHIATVNGDPWLMLDRGLDYNQNGITPENVGAGTPDTADEIPIAHGVEGMQIAYLLASSNPWNGSGTAPAAPDNGADWIIGNSAGVIEEPFVDPTAAGGTTGGTNTAPLQSALDYDPTRFTMNAANIRGVRIRITARSLLKDLSQGTSFIGDLANPQAGSPCVTTGVTPSGCAVENRTTFAAATQAALGGFRRFFNSAVVATPNLRSKDPFIF